MCLLRGSIVNMEINKKTLRDSFTSRRKGDKLMKIVMYILPITWIVIDSQGLESSQMVNPLLMYKLQPIDISLYTRSSAVIF